MSDQDPEFNEDAAYDQFPEGASDGNGPAQGFNTWVRLNNESLFTPEALEIPAVRAFVDAPIVVTYAQFKSSHRESEYFIHKPVEAMTNKVQGIGGSVDGLASDPRIATLVINHERTLARHITRALVITDAAGSTGAGGTAGQILHKEPEPA
jgi:hypothetical protein